MKENDDKEVKNQFKQIVFCPQCGGEANCISVENDFTEYQCNECGHHFYGNIFSAC